MCMAVPSPAIYNTAYPYIYVQCTCFKNHLYEFIFVLCVPHLLWAYTNRNAWHVHARIFAYVKQVSKLFFFCYMPIMMMMLCRTIALSSQRTHIHTLWCWYFAFNEFSSFERNIISMHSFYLLFLLRLLNDIVWHGIDQFCLILTFRHCS